MVTWSEAVVALDRRYDRCQGRSQSWNNLLVSFVLMFDETTRSQSWLLDYSIL